MRTGRRTFSLRDKRFLVVLLAGGALLVGCTQDTDPATDIGYTDATLHGTVDTQQAPGSGEWWFRWRKAGTSTWLEGAHHSIAADATLEAAETVHNLDPGSTYEFQACGTSASSPVVCFDSAGQPNGTSFDRFSTRAVPTTSPLTAFDLSDSVGVVSNPTYFDTPGHAPGPNGEARTAGLMADAGIHHVRNGMAISNDAGWNAIAWDNMASWHRVGITSMWVVDRCTVTWPGNIHNTIDEFLAKIAEIDGDRTDAIEGTNEPNLFCPDGWPDEERAYQGRLYDKVEASPDPVIRSARVVGPSFIRPDDNAGYLSDRITRRNTHPYTGCQSPTPHSVQENGIDWYDPADPANHPAWVSEFGFHTALNYDRNSGAQPACSEATAANYTLRSFLQQRKSGIRRSYVFTAIDLWPNPALDHPEWNFGLLRADFTPKPAYTAVKRFISTIGYGKPTTSGLRMLIEQQPPDLQTLLVQQDATHYVLAMWRTASVWNRDTQTPLSVPPAGVRLLLPDATSLQLAKPLSSSVASPVGILNRRTTIDVGGDPVLLKIAR